MQITRLTVVEDEGAAAILCGVLLAEGIDCSYRSIEPGFEGGYSYEGYREVLVFDPDLERARELLEAAGQPAVDACARCGREIREDGGWYPDDAGELHPYCGVCAERLFGPYGLAT